MTLGVRFDHYESHVPDQVQLANTIAGISVPARDFPAQAFFTWNSVVPRAGLTYDLRGDGRTFDLAGRLRLRGFADFFNITNGNAAETISFQTGSAFQRPTSILAPFTTRIGGRLEW